METVYRYIVGFIIVGIFLMVMVGVFFPEIFKILKKTETGRFLIGETERFFKGPTDFTPYEPELSDEERNVLYSMNALTCAINSVAMNSFSLNNNALCQGASSSPVTGNIIQEITGRASSTETVLKYGDVTISCKGANNLECEIDNFFLPQDLSDQSIAENFIRAYGDPKYLVYYESFPEGRDIYWHTDTESIFTMGATASILVSGALNTVFIGKGGKISREIVESGVKNAFKKTVQETSDFIIRFYSRIPNGGIDNAVRGIVIEDALQNIHGIGHAISSEVTDKIIEVIGKREGKEAIGKIEDTLKQELSPVLKKITIKPDTFSGSIEAYREKVLTDIIQGSDEFAVELSEGVTSKGVREIFSESLTKEARERIFNQAKYNTYFQRFIKKTGKEIYEFDEEAVISALKSSFKTLDALPDNVKDDVLRKTASTVTTMVEGGVKGTFGPINPLRHPVNWVWDQIPLRIAMPGAVESAAGAVGSAAGTIVGGPVGGAAGGIGAITLSWAARSVGKTALNLPAWMYNHRYPLMVLLAFNADAMDASNEKFRPVGANSLALNQPLWIGPTVAYKLYPDVRKYYIRNEDRASDRLYLVSPCQTKLIVKKKTCECTSNPLSQHYDFGGGLQDVKRGTIELKDMPDSAIKRRAEDFFANVISSPKTVTSGVEGGSFFRPERTGQPLEKEFMELDQYFDTSNAVKQCEDRGIVGSAWDYTKSLTPSFITDTVGAEDFNIRQHPSYKIPCIEFEIEKQDNILQTLSGPPGLKNYCYDDFSGVSWLRRGLMAVTIGIDLFVSGASLGTATVPALFVSGLASGVGEEVLASYEKWP